jgi:hypothetical protein
LEAAGANEWLDERHRQEPPLRMGWSRRAMKWIFRILLLVVLLALIVVGVSVVRLVIGDGPPTCIVDFDGTTYPDAVRLNDTLTAEGYDVDLKGRRGGTDLTVVLTVKGDQLFFYDSASDLRSTITDELTESDGGEVTECTEGKLTD